MKFYKLVKPITSRKFKSFLIGSDYEITYEIGITAKPIPGTLGIFAYLDKGSCRNLSLHFSCYCILLGEGREIPLNNYLISSYTDNENLNLFYLKKAIAVEQAEKNSVLLSTYHPEKVVYFRNLHAPKGRTVDISFLDGF